MRIRVSTAAILAAFCLASSSCESPAPVASDRYAAPDKWFGVVEKNVEAAPFLTKVAEIDHSRLAAKEDAVMPPARVLIFSSPDLESRLLERDPLIGLDLPLRVLSFEDRESRAARLIYNRFEYIASRYQLDMEFKDAYEQAMSAALANIPADRIAEFSRNDMPKSGIVTLDSEFDSDQTLRRVLDAIESQDDTVVFGIVDFALAAKERGISLKPAKLVLFGAPAPGAKAMRDAPTLGLDAFCQKLLVWQAANDKVHVSFNDLLVLADRHGVSRSIVLRFINRRLRSTFAEAVRMSG